MRAFTFLPRQSATFCRRATPVKARLSASFARALLLATILLFFFLPALAAQQKTESDFVIRNFLLRNGELLPELKIHYVTLGAPRRDGVGHVSNAVLLLHGTGGSSSGFFSERYSVLFQAGQPLDSSRYFIVIPDAIGHGGSSK